MKKKIIILILGMLSLAAGISLYFPSTFSKISDLEVFDIEENDF